MKEIENLDLTHLCTNFVLVYMKIDQNFICNKIEERNIVSNRNKSFNFSN